MERCAECGQWTATWEDNGGSCEQCGMWWCEMHPIAADEHGWEHENWTAHAAQVAAVMARA